MATINFSIIGMDTFTNGAVKLFCRDNSTAGDTPIISKGAPIGTHTGETAAEIYLGADRVNALASLGITTAVLKQMIGGTATLPFRLQFGSKGAYYVIDELSLAATVLKNRGSGGGE